RRRPLLSRRAAGPAGAARRVRRAAAPATRPAAGGGPRRDRVEARHVHPWPGRPAGHLVAPSWPELSGLVADPGTCRWRDKMSTSVVPEFAIPPMFLDASSPVYFDEGFDTWNVFAYPDVARVLKNYDEFGM